MSRHASKQRSEPASGHDHAEPSKHPGSGPERSGRARRKDRLREVEATKKDREREPTRWDRAKANLKTIGGAVLLALIIRVALFEAFEIEGPSMEPTLLDGDRVVVAKFSYGLFLPFADDAILSWDVPNPGEVVIVKSPHDGIDIVKRVIGIPGDTIEFRDDVVYRNGRPILDEDLGSCEPEPSAPRHDGTDCVAEVLPGHDYRTSHDIATPRYNSSPITVPDDHIYILGDHRDRSNDSRYFGVVPVSRVKGRALVIYWSRGHSTVRWHRIFHTLE